jgi:hypothetical protein
MKDFMHLEGPRNPAHDEIHSYGVRCHLSREEAFGPEELRKFAAELMNDISVTCLEYGAKDIGHVKAYIEHETGFLYADTVGDPSDVAVEGRDGGSVKRFRMTVNSVIYGLSEEAVREATEASLRSLLSKFGLGREGEITQSERTED